MDAEMKARELLAEVERGPVRDYGTVHRRVAHEAIRRALEQPASAAGDGMREIGELIRTQDNRITDQPIFIVQQKREHVADADYDHDRVVWVSEDNREVGADEAEAAEAHFVKEYEAPDGLRRLALRVEWEFVTACFTEQGCKDYLKLDGHNLREPRIYAAGSYRNEEWRAVRKFLMDLAAPTPPAAAQEDGRDAVYGYCPICGAKGAARERRPNGDDICANKHKYPSRSAIKKAAMLTSPDSGKEG
jgi:hypothetical protein